jgi:hypothetical protein
MKDLLVASVFVGSPRNETWIRLQKDFLQRTTSSFDHAVYLNRCPWSSSFEGTSVIGARSEKVTTGPTKQSADHAVCLTAIFEYFQEHRNEYSYFLILDSDCFPVRCDWLPALVRRLKDRFHFAAPLRSENLEDFPHPCALFLTQEALRRPWSFAVKPFTNLLGKDWPDVGCSLPREGWYPLLRTNVYNPHPVFAAIYRYFYHHGNGSRSLKFKSEKYYNEIDHARAEADLYAQLTTDPQQLIAQLLEPKPTVNALRSQEEEGHAC